MKVKIYRPYVATKYITIIYIVLRYGKSAVYIILISSFSRYRGLARKESKLSEFHRLIEQQIPRLRRYARALTRNRERADDLVQDRLGRALIKEQFWQPGTNL
jgi:hypothetical protein